MKKMKMRGKTLFWKQIVWWCNHNGIVCMYQGPPTNNARNDSSATSRETESHTCGITQWYYTSKHIALPSQGTICGRSYSKWIEKIHQPIRFFDIKLNEKKNYRNFVTVRLHYKSLQSTVQNIIYYFIYLKNTRISTQKSDHPYDVGILQEFRVI